VLYLASDSPAAPPHRGLASLRYSGRHRATTEIVPDQPRLARPLRSLGLALVVAVLAAGLALGPAAPVAASLLGASHHSAARHGATRHGAARQAGPPAAHRGAAAGPHW